MADALSSSKGQSLKNRNKIFKAKGEELEEELLSKKRPWESFALKGGTLPSWRGQVWPSFKEDKRAK